MWYNFYETHVPHSREIQVLGQLVSWQPVDLLERGPTGYRVVSQFHEKSMLLALRPGGAHEEVLGARYDGGGIPFSGENGLS